MEEHTTLINRVQFPPAPIVATINFLHDAQRDLVNKLCLHGYFIFWPRKAAERNYARHLLSECLSVRSGCGDNSTDGHGRLPSLSVSCCAEPIAGAGGVQQFGDNDRAIMQGDAGHTVCSQSAQSLYRLCTRIDKIGHVLRH